VLPPFDLWRSSAVAADVVTAAHLGIDALAGRRDRRLAELLAAAARGSAIYRPLLKGRDPAQVGLQELPVMRKAELMARFDEWVADPALRLDALRAFVADPARIAEPFLERYVVWESSGSSGEPGVFVQDAAAMAVYDALEAWRRPQLRPVQRMFDPWQLGERIVFLGATGGHFASTVSIERLRRLNPALATRLRSVSFLQPTPRLVDELNALAPTVIATYPSAAALLAEELEAGRLRIAPAEIWTGGETLTPALRAYVQLQFGCPVVDSYGASEFLTLACECSGGRLHLNADWVILESVDEAGAAVPAGRPGATTLLTNLANHVQPLIRYDIGDRVTLSDQACACGSSLPVIEVDGRRDDTLRFAGRDSSSVSVLPLALSTVLEDDAGMFDFQLVQRGPRDLLLRTGLCGEAGTAALRRGRAALAAFIANQGVPGVRIRCRSGEPGQPGRSGKVQRVVSMVS
jgi:phenylacetate-coenzyme A ligase PaaK-like adenylate-forming protein